MSVLLVSLTTMLKLELPHVNVLSKVDLVEKYGELPFSLDYFTEVLDLSYLCDCLDSSMEAGPPAAGTGAGAGAGASRGSSTKYSTLNRAMAELVEDFSLVNFVTCAVEDKESMAGVLRLIDKANGYCFGDLPLHPGAYHMTASQADSAGGGQWTSEGRWMRSTCQTDAYLERVDRVVARPSKPHPQQRQQPRQPPPLQQLRWKEG